MNNFKKRIIIFLFCSIFAAGIGVKINDFRHHCGSPDIVGEPPVITQSQIGRYFATDIELFHNCKFSRSLSQDELAQLNKSNRDDYSFDAVNKEKMNDLFDSLLSLLKPSNSSYSEIPILLQKESFLT